MRAYFPAFMVAVVAILFPVFAEDVAIFPVQGVNTDKSFADAFGMILSHRYAEISGQKVLTPLKAARAIESDSNLVMAASRLGVSEYIEIEAVGLYLSRKEEQQVAVDSVNGTHVYVNVKAPNDNGEPSDQKLLDNSKTIVTVTRRDKGGAEIYKAEMTLLTYGDIQESCDRIAQSLWRKIPLDKTRTMDNITRREGMGKNQLFVQKHKGIKIAAMYPLGYNGEKYSSIVGIGYDMRFDAEKFFMEFGAGGRIPTAMFNNTTYEYGGVAFELGANYFLLPGSFGLYTGGGIVPFLNLVGGGSDNSPIQFGLAPYIQIGMVVPRESRAQFYFDFRISQQLMPINSTYDEKVYFGPDTYDYNTVPHSISARPFEIGFDLGMQW
jgi:hypothetical protein